MLELLFQGFIEWIYGLILECWEYFASVLFDLMSLDFAYLREHIPIIDTIRQIMLGVGWALLIGNLVFQATRGMAAGLGFDAEDPKLLFTRTFAFSFLLVASPQICELGLNMTSTVIALLEMPDAVNITFADEASFGGLTGSWLLVVICGIIVMFQTFKLIMEMAERYFILAVLTITSPLAFGMGGSRNTSDIFNGWCRMFGSMCLLMATNVMFVKMLLSVLSYYPSGLDVLPWMVLVITIVKVAKKGRQHPCANRPESGHDRRSIRPRLPRRNDDDGRALTAVQCSAYHRQNGHQPAAAAGNPSQAHRLAHALAAAIRPMSTRPRMQTAIIIARLRSKAAQVLHPVRNLFPRRLLRHRRILYSLPQKRWRAHSLKPRLPEMASSPNSTRKTAVPPGTRRAPGHVATPKNNAAPAAGKNSAQCAVSSCGYFAARHGRRGHTEYAAGADRTFSVGIPSAQQHNSAESRRDCFARHGRKSGRPKSAAQYQSADRRCRKVVSQQQRTGTDGTDRIRTAAQHLCAAA